MELINRKDLYDSIEYLTDEYGWLLSLNSDNLIKETIEKLRKDTNYLISNPQGTGKELLEKTIYCNISMHDRMAKAGNIREAMNSIEKIKGNTVTVTSFDLETIGSAITEIGFDTAKRTIDENFRQIGKELL